MLGNLAPSVQSSVIEQLKNRPKLIVMDTMNFWMEIAMDDLKKTISKGRCIDGERQRSTPVKR
jgi:hypothetical protein